MRHNKRKTVLSRTYNQRKALIRGLLNSLIEHGSITTTQAKAKVVKSRFDKLAARLMRDNSVSRLRLVASVLAHPKNALRLKEGILPLIKDRKTGFLTSVKLNPRRGDAAPLVRLKLSVKPQGPKKEKSTLAKKQSKK